MVTSIYAVKVTIRGGGLYRWSPLAVPLSMLAEMKVARPSPDKVLREATRDEEAMLAPSTQAMEVVLRYGLKKAPPMGALKAMLLKGRAA